MSLKRVLVLLGVCTALVACGDDDGGSGATSGSGGESGEGGTGGDSGTGGSGGDAGTGGSGGDSGTGGSGGDDEDASVIGPGTVIGASGGDVIYPASGDTEALVQIPAGALDRDVAFEIDVRSFPPTAFPEEIVEPISPYYSITPHRTQFDAPVTVSIALSDSVNIGNNEVVSIWFLDDDEDTSFAQLGRATVIDGHAIFTTTHFTGFMAGRRASGSICIPQCGANECGPDTCGDDCGDCASGQACSSGFCASATEICGNRIDDNNNGDADCEDVICAQRPACDTNDSEICDNQIDDDGDNMADCADPECESAAHCEPATEICDNGISDDGDADIDCQDSDCNASCNSFTVLWTIQSNGQASNCGAVGGATVSITFDGPGAADSFASAPCSDGSFTRDVPAGTTTATLRLLGAGSNELAVTTTGPVQLTGGASTGAGTDPFNVIGGDACGQVNIARIYTRGGQSTEDYDFDFVELHNRGNQAVNVSGWSLVTVFGGGTRYQANLTGSIAANGFYLIQLGKGATDSADGLDMPAVDVVGDAMANIESYSSQLFLRDEQDALVWDAECPNLSTDPDINDVVDRYGNICPEGNQWVGGSLNTLQAIERMGSCTDSGNNGSDFGTVTITAPRSTQSTTLTCTACGS